MNENRFRGQLFSSTSLRSYATKGAAMKIHRRSQFPALLSHYNLLSKGVELGVGGGKFSERMLQNAPILRLYSIDAWAGDRNHDLVECDTATRRLSKFGARSIVIRATFTEALVLFENESLDFAYIDGYAHTGNQSGDTLRTWWKKVRPGGILAGHDYHQEKWPKNVAVVDQTRDAYREDISEFQITETDHYPSWIMRKK